MKKIFLLCLMLIFVPAVQAKRLHPEAEYQAVWCGKHNGVTEYRLSDKTRVDCLTETLAVEVDFANKWHECIGQALYYGRMTGKQAACVLIMEDSERDAAYLKRLRKTAYKKGVNLRTFTITPAHLDMTNFEP